MYVCLQITNGFVPTNTDNFFDIPQWYPEVFLETFVDRFILSDK